MPIYALASVVVLAWSYGGSRRTKHESKGEKLGSVGAVFRAAPRFWGFLLAQSLVWTG